MINLKSLKYYKKREKDLFNKIKNDEINFKLNY